MAYLHREITAAACSSGSPDMAPTEGEDGAEQEEELATPVAEADEE